MVFTVYKSMPRRSFSDEGINGGGEDDDCDENSGDDGLTTVAL